MLIDMLPEENSGFTVYAAVTENNEVIWAYDNGSACRQPSREDWSGEAMIDQDRSLFMVWKRGKIVIVGLPLPLRGHHRQALQGCDPRARTGRSHGCCP